MIQLFYNTGACGKVQDKIIMAKQIACAIGAHHWNLSSQTYTECAALIC